ncbi:hypothetical protein [Providencia burhodogranariea]|uniref:Uncharacterized protein n=1 Tax=Providencia burhodogranariea DSM 19968 TaxID=1141662 RepID=K8X3M1_9GAMM|nr:hypothetical protein [Providencia burhodogranariea]EKT63055.1 hypothetical protein OOA_06246 [Providencia burhodogranariea DSM 19968]
MFDGLGYVLAIGAVILIILLISYFNSISNAFNDTNSDNEASVDNQKYKKHTSNVKESFEKNETDNLKLAIDNKKGWKRNFLIIGIILIPMVNYAYYVNAKIPSSIGLGGGVDFLFTISTFFIFTMPNFFFNILQFKELKYLFIAFIASFILYNAIYFPQKLNVDFENKIYSFISNGDILNLEMELGKDCSLAKNELDDYLWYASFRSEAPIESLEFIFNCYFVKKDIDINNLKQDRYWLWSFFDKQITEHFKLNKHVEELFASKYFPLLDEESKQKTIWSLVYNVAHENSESLILIYINRLVKLVELNPEIINYISLRDSDYHEMIEYRRVEAANFYLKIKPPSQDSYRLAMNILTNNLPFLIEEVKKDSDILENTVINDIDSYFYKKESINLIFYAFYVSNAEVIDYLIDNQLLIIEDYNYETKTSGSYDSGCSNYLVNGIANSWTLNDDERKVFLLKLKALPNICDRTIEMELNKIEEALAKYKS